MHMLANIRISFFTFLADYLQRRSRIVREKRASRELKKIRFRREQIKSSDIIAVVVTRDERKRLPFFLKYYRSLGVNHFYFIDHLSQDDTEQYLLRQSDCSIWRATGSYSQNVEGIMWSNYIISAYANKHWILRLDPDEFLVFPYCDSRNLHELTEYLDSIQKESFFTPLIDCYALSSAVGFAENDDMIKKFPFFDKYGYHIVSKMFMSGGFRQRVFYPENSDPPFLVKYSLVKWNRGIRYLASTHRLSPDSLNSPHLSNRVCPTGCLLHYKITEEIQARAKIEIQRKDVFSGALEYEHLIDIQDEVYFHEEISEKYNNWQSLEKYGLLTTGSWR